MIHSTNNRSALIRLHFKTQHEFPTAYFSDAVSMQKAPGKLKLPYGRTTFLRLLSAYNLTGDHNMPVDNMLMLGFMKFQTNTRSLGPAVTFTPLMTLSGLNFIKSFIPAEVLYSPNPLAFLQHGTE